MHSNSFILHFLEETKLKMFHFKLTQNVCQLQYLKVALKSGTPLRAVKGWLVKAEVRWATGSGGYHIFQLYSGTV